MSSLLLSSMQACSRRPALPVQLACRTHKTRFHRPAHKACASALGPEGCHGPQETEHSPLHLDSAAADEPSVVSKLRTATILVVATALALFNPRAEPALAAQVRKNSWQLGVLSCWAYRATQSVRAPRSTP